MPNFAVIIYEKGYPVERGSIATLVGIYPTKEAARFISQKVRTKERLDFFPNIRETDESVTTDKVEDYLRRQGLEKKRYGPSSIN